MNRSLFVGIFIATAAVTAFAQVATPKPRPKADRGIVLEGEQKMRYICKQLELNETQEKDVDSLIAVYNATMKEETSPAALLQFMTDLQVMMTEREEAKAAGNTQRVKEINEQIKASTPGNASERQFFEGLEGMLTETQQKKLVAVRKRIASNPDVTLTPHDVVEAARAQNLDKDQRDKLDSTLKEYRAMIAKNRPSTLQDRMKSVDKLIDKVGGVLNADQKKAFMAEIERMRPPTELKPVKLQMGKPQATKPRVIVKQGNVQEIDDPQAEMRKRQIIRKANEGDKPKEPADEPAKNP